MSDTYSQVYVHCVFAVKYRKAVLDPAWDERLRLYITAIIQNNGHKMIAINNMPDHLHLFFNLKPAQSISEIMRLVKGDSSEWINKQKLTPTKFRWQEGYGVFSYSRSQIRSVANYVDRQQEHHRNRSFLNEYRELLNKFGVDYEEKRLFIELTD